GESQFIPVENVEEYDLQSKSWTKIDDTPAVMNIHTSILYGTEIYIFGGSKCGITSLCPTSDVWSYKLSGWTLQPSGITNELEGIFLTDANKGIAVGGDGTILRTTDGGKIWTSQSSGTTNWLLDVCFTDTETGTVVGGENCGMKQP
ncbi:MAG: hypothetical protein IH908_08590, partial [Proteobacteria bacterium]|nr:hypothetical protein [Pseudomonadota bacterium]